jgi:hypothetical protein
MTSPSNTEDDGLHDARRRLAAAMLLRAVKDAQDGDAEALSWLKGPGRALALALDLDEGLRQFLQQQEEVSNGLSREHCTAGT